MMREQNQSISEQVRNAAILIYMIGNALTFTKLLSTEWAGGADEPGGRILRALLLSFVWPFYWIGRLLFG